MEEIEVRKEKDEGDALEFDVSVGSEGSSTDHEVTVNKEDMDRLKPEEVTAARLVEESFRFLLEREPKESILSRFNIMTISDYFPEYKKKIKDRL